MARKLLSLGIEVCFEPTHITLDKPIEVAGKNRRTGKSRVKKVTTPDFYFVINGVECYLEIGSGRATAHKRRQARVMETAMNLDKSKPTLYVQLFRDDIRLLEEYVETTDDLLAFLYEHELAIYTR